MKTTALLIAVLLLASSGCKSLTESTLTSEKIQTALTNVLPPDFAGDFTFTTSNPYFHIGFKVGGIHKTADGKWTWASLEYDRGDFWNTAGHVALVPAGNR